MQNKNKSYLDALKEQWTYSMQILGGIVLLLYFCSFGNAKLQEFNFATLPAWFVIVYALGAVFGGAYYKKNYCVTSIEVIDDVL